MKDKKIKIFATVSCRVLKKEIKTKLKDYLSDNYALHFVGNALDHFQLRNFGADIVIKRTNNKWRTIIVNGKLRDVPSLV